MSSQHHTATALLENADAAFAQWRSTDISERTWVLSRAADLYLERANEIATAMAHDMGKPVSQGMAEASSCAAILKYYADCALQLLSPDVIAAGTSDEARVELLPTGVILGVMPWNYPHYQLVRLVAPNLILGNAVLFKHARICHRSAALLDEIFLDAGAPQHLVSNSGFTHEETASAIHHPVITGVSFTGGEAAGAEIAAVAGAASKKVVLELGGNDPFIVFDDARVAELAQTAASTRLLNAGQTCVSPKRIIVKESLMDDFLGAFIEHFLPVRPDDPLLSQTVLGPLATNASAQELRLILQDAEAFGVKILGDLRELQREGRAFSPLIVLDPPRDHPVWTNELFGPVAVITAATDAAEALELANDSVYGLGATVFTPDPDEADLFVKGLECGMVAVNRLKGGNPAFPFGGVKQSGFGRELGAHGLREFANQRIVVTAR